MKIIDIIKRKIETGEPLLSVEVIPPRNGAVASEILEKVKSLAEANPDFMSVTRGAGGSLRGGTVPIAFLIKQKTGIETMVHLTCIDTSIEELENILVDHKYLEIDNILALRGDPPSDAPPEYLSGRGFHYHKYARDLVRQINKMNRGEYLARAMDYERGKIPKDQDFRSGEPTSFCIAVAGHPDGHEECPDADVAMSHLAEKVKAGAEVVFTQMVFSVETYKKFVDDARKIGIEVPIIPGVRPITRLKQIALIEDFFKVPVADVFKKELEGHDAKEVRKRGVELTANLCRGLLGAGAPGIHFFIMNDVDTGKHLITEVRKIHSKIKMKERI